MIRALKKDTANSDLTEFWLCKEFGWTPKDLKEQRAKDIEKFIVILNEVKGMQRSKVEGDVKKIIVTSDEKE